MENLYFSHPVKSAVPGFLYNSVTNPTGMKSIHEKLTSAGVILILVDNLNENANCKLTQIWKGLNNAEKAEIEVGEVETIRK